MLFRDFSNPRGALIWLMLGALVTCDGRSRTEIATQVGEKVDAGRARNPDETSDVICEGANDAGQAREEDQEEALDDPGETPSAVPVCDATEETPDDGVDASPDEAPTDTPDAKPPAAKDLAIANLGGSSGAPHLFAGNAQLCWLDGNRTQINCYDSTLPDIPLYEPNIVTFALGGEIQQIVLGWDHGCALRETGDVICWGGNDFGQLGLGDTLERSPLEVESLSPVDLGTGTNVLELAVRGTQTCALLDGGTVKCWGNSLGDSLGDEPGEMGDALPLIDLGTDQRAVGLGTFGSALCAVLDTGELKCWGGNSNGQLGQGDTRARYDADDLGDNLLPFSLGTGLTVTQLRGGTNHFCALLRDTEGQQRVKCWGDNQFGQLGIGDTQNRGDQPGEMGDALPFAELGSGNPVELALGTYHSCARFEDGRVKCWGLGSRNVLGSGRSSFGSTPETLGEELPSLDFQGKRAVQIAAGSLFTCALFEAGDFGCWGEWFVQILR